MELLYIVLAMGAVLVLIIHLAKILATATRQGMKNQIILKGNPESLASSDSDERQFLAAGSGQAVLLAQHVRKPR